MDSSFWLNKWELNQIGFHKEIFNHNLTENFDKLDLPKGSHVFVPLAGKSLDIIWLLKQGHQVSAIELSSIAIKAFFYENKLSYKFEDKDGVKKYISNNLTFYEGDLFNLNFNGLEKIDCIYDRASMIALDPEQRKNYFAILKSLLDKGSKILLVALEYDQFIFEGPPFSVTYHEIFSELGDQYQLALISENETENKPKNFSDTDKLIEKVYIIQGRVD